MQRMNLLLHHTMKGSETVYYRPLQRSQKGHARGFPRGSNPIALGQTVCGAPLQLSLTKHNYFPQNEVAADILKTQSVEHRCDAGHSGLDSIMETRDVTGRTLHSYRTDKSVLSYFPTKFGRPAGELARPETFNSTTL